MGKVLFTKELLFPLVSIIQGFLDFRWDVKVQLAFFLKKQNGIWKKMY